MNAVLLFSGLPATVMNSVIELTKRTVVQITGPTAEASLNLKKSDVIFLNTKI